jgi:hypothetical protein
MKMVSLLLFACFVVVRSSSATLTPTQQNSISGKSLGEIAKLKLETSVVERKYCRAGTSTDLSLTLKLSFTNIGTVPIVLDKNSSAVGREMVSQSLENAAARKYVYDARGYVIDLPEAGVRLHTDPKPEFFVTLEPSQSFFTEQALNLSVYDGSKDTDDELHPGRLFLQIFVHTWYFIAPPDKYSDQWWKTKGYLWSQGIKSNPMLLIIEKHPRVVACSK